MTETQTPEAVVQLREELIRGAGDTDTAVVMEHVADEYQVYSQEMRRVDEHTHTAGNTGDVAQYATRQDADEAFNDMVAEAQANASEQRVAVAYDPSTSGTYTVPSQSELAHLGTTESRAVPAAAVQAMSEHRPATEDLPEHQVQKLWEIVHEIDAYEEARMIHDGLVRGDQPASATLNEQLLDDKGHQSVAHYLAHERNYPDQVDYAASFVQAGYADGVEPSTVAHIGRANTGLDGARHGQENPGSPMGWIQRYEADTRFTRATADMETFGPNSHVFSGWEHIHPDYKTIDTEGHQLVMALHPSHGTVLTQHHGPEMAELIREQAAQTDKNYPSFEQLTQASPPVGHISGLANPHHTSIDGPEGASR